MVGERNLSSTAEVVEGNRGGISGGTISAILTVLQGGGGAGRAGGDHTPTPPSAL